MAQIIPPITSLPIDSIAAPSAEDIQDRLPSICVDYLSHDWSEEDVWASWRSMTRHKHEIANGVRLENASWRTWQKQRNKLKTISPETLNWLKDSDVTWLYGPLHTAHVEPVRPLKISTADERLGIDLPKGYKPGSPTVATNNNQMKDGSQMKPILKHRTLSEMLTIPMPSSPILESSNFGNDKDVDEMGSPGNRPMLLQTKSDTNIFGGRTTSVRERNPPKFPPETGASGTKTFVPPESAMEGEPAPPPSGKKHISFNTFVEQCVAIDEAPISRMSDSDDDMLEMRSSASSSSRSSRPSISRHSSSASSEHLTIAKIAPTMLKTNGVQIANLPQMVYMPPPEYQSPQLDQSQAVSFDFPSPQVQTRNKWGSSLSDDDDDEYGSVGYDYFGGPDLGGGGQQSVPAHVGTSYGRQQSPSVNVNQAPAQAKWRQQPQQRQQPPVQQQTQPIPQPPSSQSTSTQSSEPSSVGSSSGSLNNIMSPPVPSRGILKVRPPGTTPPEPSSPPTSYFNYNPSAATGIGGMRGQYDYAAPPPVSGSPLVSPATAETRGRSSSRGPGSSAAFDRSSSRGTSVGSSHSLSPGASNAPIVRSPVETQKRAGAQVTSPGNAVPTVKPAQTTPQTGSTAKQQSLLKDPPPQVIQEEQAEASDPTDSMDVDEDEPYQVDRSGTPTPHSSPQIAFRPMKDTSPASLPHTSTRNAPVGQTNPYFPPTPSGSGSGSGAYSPSHSPELPKADPPTTRGKATTAHVGTTAQPTLSQPPLADDDDEGDGSSIMGRAANIANTAKDLLGALWYGHEGAKNSLERTVSGGSSPGAGGGGGTGQGAPGQVGSAQRQVWGMVQKQQGHKRGASMG